MTNGWTDISNADVILAMGGNPAENHPVGFRFVMEAERRRGAKLVAVDPRLQHPRSVFQLMKKFYSRYTPQKVSEVCGCNAEAFTKAAEIITSTYTPTRVGTIMYALGWTHHSFSVQLIKTAAMLQLLLGNVGMPGGGVNALRGHANIQGGTDMGMAYHNVPGYMPIPKAAHQSLEDFFKVAVP